MRIAIYYDSLITKGGAQRVIIELANRLGADIVTSGFNEEINKWIPCKGKVIDIGNISYKYSIPLSFFFETPLRFMLYKKADYDINIFFGISSIFAAKKGRLNIWFCFSPNRLLYDLREWKLKDSSIIKKLFFKTHILLFAKPDQNAIKHKITRIIAQTEHVKLRIKKYYNKDSYVVFSPLDTTQYRFDELGDYYLAVSRLMPEKRMDVIAKVFTKLKDRKLILVGTGPEENKVKKIIKDSSNITLLSNISEQELIDLYAKCFATIYIPIEEDFGLPPLESMASGKICVAANEGGCKETIVNNQTGYLIDVSENNLTATIKSLKKDDILKLKNNCLKQAKKFDVENNVKQWKKLLNETHGGRLINTL